MVICVLRQVAYQILNHPIAVACYFFVHFGFYGL